MCCGGCQNHAQGNGGKIIDFRHGQVHFRPGIYEMNTLILLSASFFYGDVAQDQLYQLKSIVSLGKPLWGLLIRGG